MKILIINGPNLNLLGEREKEIYGEASFELFLEDLKRKYPNVELTYFQSNIEGEIINKIQEFRHIAQGVIINPGGYSHTSVAIADAIKLVKCQVVEVHISNIYARESYRHQSITGSKCKGVISGLGLNGYELALQYLIQA